jgi:hypothetical protein
MADISNPSIEEISFLRKLYDAGGELVLQGGVGLQKIERLFPDYVTLQGAGFTLTEKGRQFINRWWLKPPH